MDTFGICINVVRVEGGGGTRIINYKKIIIRFRQHRTRSDTVFYGVRRVFDFRRGNGARFRHLRRLAVRALPQRETVDRHRKAHRKYYYATSRSIVARIPNSDKFSAPVIISRNPKWPFYGYGFGNEPQIHSSRRSLAADRRIARII